MMLGMFVFINVLLVFFVMLLVRNYRRLNRELRNIGYKNNENHDAMSLGFLEKIFHAHSDNAVICNYQKRVVFFSVVVALLMAISRHIFQFI